MKKSFRNLALTVGILFTLSSLTGCATITDLGDKISGIFKGDEASSSQNTKTAIKTDSQKNQKALVSSSLKTPDSYKEAYKYRTDKADKTIQTFIKSKNTDALRSSNPNEYIKSVCAKITETAANDFEKVKSAHDAVCLLVSYDAKNFWANSVPDQSWQNVLKTKTAVCEGYANLFQRYMSELKINSAKVSGYARGVGTSILKENPKDSNHAWNAVQIEGCWYLIDCTWDSGYMSGKNSVQSYSTDWLFLNPEHFICTHFPDNPKYQLIQPALSLAEFSVLPDFRPKLFELAGESLSSVKKVNEAADFYEIEYRVKEEYSLSFNISRDTGAPVNNRSLTEKDGGLTVTRMNFPEAGIYSVQIFYFKEGAKQGNSCGLFLVKTASGNSIKYPTLYNVSAANVSLTSPKESPLKAGETISFDLHAEGKAFAAVIIGKNFNQLENDGNGNFTGQLTIPAGTKQVSIAFSSKQTVSYETYAVYEVE